MAGINDIGESELARRKAAISALPARGAASPIQGIAGGLPAGPASPMPTPTVRATAAASGRSIPGQQATMDRMAADRAARLNAMKAGGIDALDSVVARQSGAVPAARPITAAAAASPVTPPAAAQPSMAARAGQAVGDAGRSVRANPKSAAAGAIAGVSMVDNALDTDSTARYAKRFGMDEPTGDGSIGDMAKFGAVRALGAGSEIARVGLGIADAPIHLWNKVADMRGKPEQTLRPFNSMVWADEREADSRVYGSDASFIPSKDAYDKATAAQPQAAPAAAQSRDMPAMTVRPDAAQDMSPMTVRPGIGDLPDDGAVSANGRKLGYGKMVDGVATFSDGSGAGGVPRTMSDSQIADLGGRASAGIASGGSIAPGGYRAAADAAANRAGQEDANYLGLINRDARERSSMRDKSQARLEKLYSQLDSALFAGKRRTAAVITDAIRAEAGITSGALPNATPDVRRTTQNVNPAEFAQADNYAAETQKTQLSADRQKRINSLLDAYIANPDSAEGQKALKAMQAAEGKVTDKLYPVDVPGGIDEFGSPIKFRGLANDNGQIVYDPSKASGSAGNNAGGGQNAGAPVEGKTYVDANGNRAVYKNGTYVPIGSP